MQETKFHRVAGLDLSLRKAGVALFLSEKEVKCFTVGYQLTKKATARDRLERVIFIASEIMGILTQHSIRYVGVENYAFGAKFGGEFLADLGGFVKGQIYISLKTIPFQITPANVRKYLLGRESRDKTKVRSSLKKMGFDEPSNLDESDALAVALVVRDWANFRSRISDDHKMDTFSRLDNQHIRTYIKSVPRS